MGSTHGSPRRPAYLGTGFTSSEGGISLVATEAGSRWQGADPTGSPRSGLGFATNLPPTAAGADLHACEGLCVSLRRWDQLASSADPGAGWGRRRPEEDPPWGTAGLKGPGADAATQSWSRSGWESRSPA